MEKKRKIQTELYLAAHTRSIDLVGSMYANTLVSNAAITTINIEKYYPYIPLNVLLSQSMGIEILKHLYMLHKSKPSYSSDFPNFNLEHYKYSSPEKFDIVMALKKHYGKFSDIEKLIALAIINEDNTEKIAERYRVTVDCINSIVFNIYFRTLEINENDD